MGQAVGGPDSPSAGDHGGGCIDGTGRSGLRVNSGEGDTPARGSEGGTRGGGRGDNDDGARGGGVCRGGWGAILIVKLQNFHLKCKNHEYFHLKCNNHE
jgi:hypothetical protein